MPMPIAFILFFLGLACGSFVNALVWRLHENNKKPKNKQLPILNGRSMCPNCKHQLAWYDLIPIVSWLLLSGRCRYCKQPISIQYPVVELVAGIVFGGSYLLWPESLDINGQLLLLVTWLITFVGLLALTIYDLRWMILPNKIIYPTLAVAATSRLIYIIFYENRPVRAFLMWVFSIAIASGIFLALFVYSKGKWIGYGDVRLGLITGTLLADPAKSLAMIFLASFIGTLIIAPGLVSGRKALTSKLPYGPFLIAATSVMVLFGDSLLDWYKSLIL
jgi:leader peptidase (prepilin peptidase)/N-methyltransferase